LKAETHKLSIRAKELLEKKEFFKASQENDFEVILDSSDKILTATYSSSSTEIELLFKEIISKFSKGRSLKQALEINFRELESFLRDENHLPAFPEESSQELSELLKELKLSLVTSALYSKNPSFKELSEALLRRWQELSLVEKNQWAQRLISEIQKELNQNFELLWCDETSLTIKTVAEQASGLAPGPFLLKLLGGSKKLLPIKVVAV
jgi:hypothetical protein